MKTTNEPAGKWIKIGVHEVICEEHGKILACIVNHPTNAVATPVTAYVGSREIGRFISAAHARAAVNRLMNGFDDEHGSILKSMIARFQKMREEASA